MINEFIGDYFDRFDTMSYNYFMHSNILLQYFRSNIEEGDKRYD